jgi:hypothetical protein
MSTRTGYLSSSQKRDGVTLDFQFDPQAREIRLLGQGISWDTANVILVDRVDSVGGPPSVRAVREDLSKLPDPERLASEPDSVYQRAAEHRSFKQLLAELPVLREFLRPSP